MELTKDAVPSTSADIKAVDFNALVLPHNTILLRTGEFLESN